MKGIASGVARKASAHASAQLATRADRPTLERERMRPSERFHDTHRKSAVQLAIDRIVMSHGGDAGEEILEAPDEQTIAKGVGTILTNARIVVQRRPQVVDPGGGVFITIAALQPAVVIELEVIVRVDQSWQHERSVEIDDEIAVVWRFIEGEDAAGKTDRRRRAVVGRDASVDERHGTGSPKHHRRVA